MQDKERTIPFPARLRPRGCDIDTTPPHSADTTTRCNGRNNDSGSNDVDLERLRSRHRVAPVSTGLSPPPL